MSILSNNFYYQPLKIDSVNTQVYGDFIAKEGDANGRGLLVTLTENGLLKDTTGITLNLKWAHTTVAGVQGLDPFESIDLTKGLYKVTYPTNMLRKGKVDAFIQIIDSGSVIGSRNIKINVEATVGDDAAIESSNVFTALASALVEVQSWNGRIDDVEQDFIDRANNLDATYPTRLVSVESQLADTDTRIDNIIATAGDGTIPSELSDLRTNNWSDIFGAAGGRLLLAEKLLDKLLNRPSFSLINGSYRATGGWLAAKPTMSYTSAFGVKKGQTILVYADCQNSNVAVLTKTRKTNQTIAVLVNSVGAGYNYYYYTATEDCYVSASFDNTKNNNIFIYNAPTTDMVTETPISLTLTDGYYINTAGAAVSATGYSYSAPIHLKANDFVTIELAIEANVPAVFVANAAGTKRTPLFMGNGFTTKSTYTYLATEDCYIVVCGGNAYDIVVKIKSYGNLLSQYENQTTITPTFTNGYYWTAKGIKVTIAGYSYTNPIKVKKGQRVKAYVMGYQTGVAVISTCDKNAIYTKPRTICTDSRYRLYTYDVTEDGYITVCGQTGFISDVTLETINDLTSLNASVVDYTAYKNLFANAIAIGDSITYGYRDTQTSLPNKSYPVYLSNLSGWTVANAGVSGITAKGWWDTKAQTYNYANYDVAIIKLGQNEGLTDTLLTDVTGTDYTAYADTNTGDYCKIIEYIKSQNTDIKIFLVGIQYPNDTITNKVIQQIATKYNLPYLDLDTNGYQDLYSADLRATYTNYLDVHFNTIGYITLAKVIFYMMCEYIANNQSAFSDIV